MPLTEKQVKAMSFAKLQDYHKLFAERQKIEVELEMLGFRWRQGNPDHLLCRRYEIVRQKMLNIEQGK